SSPLLSCRRRVHAGRFNDARPRAMDGLCGGGRCTADEPDMDAMRCACVTVQRCRGSVRSVAAARMRLHQWPLPQEATRIARTYKENQPMELLVWLLPGALIGWTASV